MNNKITISVPGKLMLAGEWSVLQKGNPCIVASVDRYVSVTISKSDTFFLYAKDFDIKTTFQWDKDKIIFEKQFEKLNFAKKVLEVVFKYFQEQKITINTFSLDINSSEFLLDGKKLGLGSSAAVVVGVISAILKFHGYDVAKKTIFKLACIAHFYAQGKVGSCFDVAASTYGCVLWYKCFDIELFQDKVNKKNSVSDIVHGEWEGLEIEKIYFPKKLNYVVGFVGNSASTKVFVKKVKHILSQQVGIDWSAEVSKVVIRLRKAIESGDTKSILRCVDDNNVLLRQLSEMSEGNLETKELRTLIASANRYQAAAKFSGAGGGDCGIAFCKDDYTAGRVRDVWRENYIIPLDLKFN